jgi:hypothetical protein
MDSDEEILKLLIEIRDELRAANSAGVPIDEREERPQSGVSESELALVAAQARTAAAIQEMRDAILSICTLLEDDLRDRVARC